MIAPSPKQRALQTSRQEKRFIDQITGIEIALLVTTPVMNVQCVFFTIQMGTRKARRT